MPGPVVVILGGLLAAMSCSSPARASENSVSAAVKDEAGILVHTVQSEYQSARTKIRVLLPRPLEKSKRYRDGPKREHSWHSGWLPEAVQMLAQDNRSSTAARRRKEPSTLPCVCPHSPLKLPLGSGND